MTATAPQTDRAAVEALARELTDEQWDALLDADAGVYLTPERRDLVRGPLPGVHLVPRLVVHSWAGGLRPDYQHVTVHGRALLRELDVLRGFLPERGEPDERWTRSPLGRAVLRRAKEQGHAGA